MKAIIIGLGSVAQKHIKALKEISRGIKIYALRSSPDVPSLHGIANIYDYADIPSDASFAIISNPTALHEETIRKILPFRIPLFIEKPPLHSTAQSSALLNEINKKRIITYVGCVVRFHPCIQFLKKYLTKKQLRINEVNIYCGSYLPDWRPVKNFRESYSARPELGGGVHLDLFHEVDCAYWLFGGPLKTTKLLRNVSSLNITAIDYAHYIFEYNSFTLTVTLNYFRKDPRRTLEVVFDSHTLTIDLLQCCILDNKGTILFSSALKMEDLFLRQMQYFIRCVTRNSHTFNTFADSVKILRYCLD